MLCTVKFNNKWLSAIHLNLQEMQKWQQIYWEKCGSWAIEKKENRVQGRGFQDKNLSVNTTYTEENYFQGIHLQCSLRSLVGDNWEEVFVLEMTLKNLFPVG